MFDIPEFAQLLMTKEKYATFIKGSHVSFKRCLVKT